MAKQRQLVRTLGFLQVLMLGVGGTMGAGIFVLIGHAAGMVGPALILALLVAGLVEFFTALDYAELASSFPIAGGGYAYVSRAREGFLPFSVGWVSWFGAMFYCALSAVGFALSLRIFLPVLPVSATAVGIVAIFTIVNLRGSEEAGRTQVILAGILLASRWQATSSWGWCCPAASPGPSFTTRAVSSSTRVGSTMRSRSFGPSA